MKVKKGVGISAIKGKLGGFIIQDPASGTTLRVKTIETYPKSLAQFRTKSRFAAVQASWRNLSILQQAAWHAARFDFPRLDQFGVIYYLTGFELFSFINNNLIQYGFAPFILPPAAGVVPPYTTVSYSADDVVNIYISPAPGLVPADNICEVWATPQLSRGRSYYQAKFRLIGQMPPLSVAPFDITAMYTAVFGPIQNKWSVILCRIRNLLSTTGQADPNFYQTNIYLPAMCPDQNLFVPNPEWPPLPVPAMDHLKFIMSDNQDRRIVFSATISGAASYTVDVYGAGGALIFSQTLANNATFDYTVPAGGGYPCTGYTAYIVDVHPTLVANHLTGFRVKTVFNYTITNWQILYCRINAPYITDLASAFYGIDALESVTFDSNMDALTTLATFCYGGLSLKSIQFPSMLSLTTLTQAFRGCNNLKICNFPSTLPALQSLSFTFYQCYGLLNLTYPADLPALTDMNSAHYQCSALLTCVMPVTAHLLATMPFTFYQCRVLQSVTMPADLHHLVNLNATFRDCNMITAITLPVNMPLVSNLQQTFMDCHKLVSLTFPATMNAVTTAMSMCQSCWSLVSITDLEMPANQSYNGSFVFCGELLSLRIKGTAANVTDMSSIVSNCLKLTSVIFPASMDNVTTMASAFSNCFLMTTCTLPTSMAKLTTMSSAFNFCQSIVTVTLPATLTLLQNMTSCFYNCSQLVNIVFPANLPAINNMGTFASVANPVLTNIGPTTFGNNQVDAIAIIKGDVQTTFNYPSLRVSRISIVANAPAAGNALTSIDINWAASLYAGAAPQILFTYQNIDAVEIDRIFTALPVVVGKQINVKNCTGALTCHPAIATAKGWSVITA